MTILTGTSGNDTYQGATGVADTAVIGANSTTASFAFEGAWRVSSTAGWDTLYSVESVQFNDATFGLRPGMSYLGFAQGSSTSIARLSGGGWVVVYQSTNDGSGSGIAMQRFIAAGDLLGSVTQVNTTTTNSQTLPSATGLAGGGYVVAWQSYAPNPSTGSYEHAIMYQRYDAAGNKVGGEVRGPAGASSVSEVKLAGTSSGGFAMTWNESNGTTTTLWVRLHDGAGGSVGSPVSIATFATGYYTSTTGPELVALEGGGYVSVWQQVTGNGSSIFQQRISATGEKIGAAVQVDTGSPLYSYNREPAVAALEDGSYVVAWTQGTTLVEKGLLLQRYASDGTKLGNAYAIEGGAQVWAGESIAATGLDDGGFVVAWRGIVNSTYGVYVQRFDAGGAAAGPPQSVTGMSNQSGPMDPDVVSLENGGFAVSWTSSGYAYTQRFNEQGFAEMSEITGTLGNDVITYTSYTNVKLIGGGGDDSLTGGSGKDVLDGGAGADTLAGGHGDDTYLLQAGDVVVNEYSGNDTVITSVGYTLTNRHLENVVLTGTSDGDLIGNSNANKLTGNAADNILNGGGGADTLSGGAGNDTYIFDNVGDRAFEGAGGFDIVISSASTTLGDNIEHLRLRGAVAIDGAGNGIGNLITGNSYANRLDGKGGTDTLIGGLGDDTYVVGDGENDDYREYDGEGSDTIEINRSYTLDSALDSIENLTLGEGGAFSATGDGIANVLKGNSQDNVLDGKAGADTMDGGLGNDVYMVGDAADVAAETGWGGTDLVKSTVTHTLGANIENLTLLTTAALNGTGNEGMNVITGNAGANRLDGKGSWDTLVGGAGNDRLTSADGLDVLMGGTGHDTYIVSSSDDEVIEGAGEGTDSVTASLATGLYAMADNIENLTLVGMHIDGRGNALNNTIMGTVGDNLLDGGKGADRLTGLAGDDTYIVDSAGDVVVEAALAGLDEVFAMVSHTLALNVENLTLGGTRSINGTGNTLDNRLIGNEGENALSGGAGTDVLFGYEGSDRLDGGTGSDTLKGGTGSDTFAFSSALGATNVDQLADFSVADDTIELASVIFTALVNAGPLAAGNLRAGAGVTTAADANDFILYNTTTGALYYDADGSGAASAAVQFAIVGAGLALTAADFVVV